MSRNGSDYYNREKPVVFRVGRLMVRFYREAGVVQFYNIQGRPGGEDERLSKGVVLHMDSLEPPDLDKFDEFMNAVVQMEHRNRKTLPPATKPEPGPRKREDEVDASELLAAISR